MHHYTIFFCFGDFENKSLYYTIKQAIYLTGAVQNKRVLGKAL